jgi:hypothetical protein
MRLTLWRSAEKGVSCEPAGIRAHDRSRSVLSIVASAFFDMAAVVDKAKDAQQMAADALKKAFGG